MDYQRTLLKRIYAARQRADTFFIRLRTDEGYRYTATHNLELYPAGLLYGTWACILGLELIKNRRIHEPDEKDWAVNCLQGYLQADDTFYPSTLIGQPGSKSVEYLKLHCTNYSIGALLRLVRDYDFESKYFNPFLDGDFLGRWLAARSLMRPWEEGNNIINVTSYLALCDSHGIPNASDRLNQMYDWHKKVQNPKTGGFDCFQHSSYNSILQSLAGAVHNFHLYHYLKAPLVYETQIASRLPIYLFQGALTACLSLDFVELGIRVLPYSQEPQLLTWALLEHVESLLSSQRPDGGWIEADSLRTPTSAAGFQDREASSCSYATWFRLCSLAMVSIVLLGDQPGNWKFRTTLGMGYAPEDWPELPGQITIDRIPLPEKTKMYSSLFPRRMKNLAISFGSRLLG